ncbi:sulfite reductase subunit gamma [Paramagnetospirillum kuznetsovii]|uniref:Sulfite reductase subunit gamma n=1 Tax=Paramagnetospirillum kuznetsovii TaxID=2053833 RepID=A0A364NUX0_9PROT|nr:TusE/DsrC/DsvC family sulfur relay protein [Paramagnetospirillum kuznetsovii]RAU20878.1 sulfite reductase subunit gamma [Paramagnetospirillum kuznetsovii]
MPLSPALDPEGYLTDPADWSEEVAGHLAATEGITLTEEHWIAIRFMRAWLDDRQVAPDVRHVIKHLTETTGAGRNRLFELFPYGYVQQACKIAGMRRPRSWSTG